MSESVRIFFLVFVSGKVKCKKKMFSLTLTHGISCTCFVIIVELTFILTNYLLASVSDKAESKLMFLLSNR